MRRTWTNDEKSSRSETGIRSPDGPTASAATSEQLTSWLNMSHEKSLLTVTLSAKRSRVGSAICHAKKRPQHAITARGARREEGLTLRST